MAEAWFPPIDSGPDEQRSGVSRIIRPAQQAAEATPLELNLEDVQALAEQCLREARERVAELESRAMSLERSTELRRAEAEEALLSARGAADRELAEWKERRRAEEEAARLAGREEGLSRGEAEGRARGQQEGYRKGFEEGYAEGRQSGYLEAREAERARIAGETAPLCEILTRMAAEITDRRRAIAREARAELLPLALEIAKVVIKREVRECPEVVLHNVRKAIDLAFRRTALVVEVHPDDHRLVERYSAEVFGAFNGLSEVNLRPRDDVQRGGCRVTTGSGVVDLRIEAQLEMIEQALFGALEESCPDEVITPALPAALAVEDREQVEETAR